MERMPFDRLAPHERKELEAALRDPTRFLSDYGDTAAWWILLLIAAGAGAVASGMQIWEAGLEGLRFFSVRAALYPLGLLASLAVVLWTAVTWVRNHGRRGYAVTSFATIRVKGPRLVLVRHADVARMEWIRHRTRKQRFSSLKLTGRNGKSAMMYVHAGWVRTAIAQIDQSRAAAGLPPIEGEARILPE